MTTDDTISDLDAALTGEGATPDFEEAHPDAPEWAVELVDEIEENAAALDELERQKAKRRQRWQRELRESIERTTERIATLATNAGVATEDEVDLAKAARASGGDEPTGLGRIFTPGSNAGDDA